MTSDGGPGNGLEKVALTNLGTVRGGVPIRLDRSPGYGSRLVRVFQPPPTRHPRR